MNTTPKAAPTNPILALDLGKYKSVASLYRSADDVPFPSVPTTQAELRRLIEKNRPEVVLIEACLLCGWVRDLCIERGVRCLVANTTSEAWKLKHLKRKKKRGRESILRIRRKHYRLPTPFPLPRRSPASPLPPQCRSAQSCSLRPSLD